MGAQPVGGAKVKRSVNTIIVEPGTLLREGLVALLHDSPFRIVAAVAGVCKIPSGALERADLLIVGASSDPARALDYVKQVSASARDIHIIVFAESYGGVLQPDTMEFLRNGADGCIFDVHSRDILLKSLNLVVMGQRIVILGETDASRYTLESQERSAGLSTHDPPINGDARLSPRELEILSYIATGNSNKVIARSCNLAESTVKIHLKAILRKIRVQNRTQAAVWAIQNADRQPRNIIAPSIILWFTGVANLMRDHLGNLVRDNATGSDFMFFLLCEARALAC
jgi:two-component system, NarL family, nitrate/nitrite response regulator NarL